jgi:hypothetical protein
VRDRLHALARGLRETPAWLLAVVIGAVAFYLVGANHYGQMPLRIEEGEWPPMARAVFESGEPVIPATEDHRVRFTEDLQVDQTEFIGAWHPPLYIYALGASMAFVGEDASYNLRGVGVASLLASALLLILIAREVTPRWRLIGGIAAALLLIHPYAIQGSLFLDIDTTVYPPLILLVLWLAIRFGKRQAALGTAQILALGAALALVTWAKMTTTIALVGVLVVWWLLTRRPIRRAALEAVAFVCTGAVLFFGTYAVWCAATGIRFSYTFDVTFGAKSNRLFSSWTLVENAAHWHLRWFGAALLLLSAIYLVDLLRHLIAHRTLRPLDLPFLFGLGVLANYVVASPTDGTYQGKYAFPALAALLLPVTWMLLRGPQPRPGWTRWAAVSVVAVVAAWLMPDVLTGLSVGGVYGTWEFEFRVIAASAAALLIAWGLTGGRGFAAGVVIVLAALFVAQSVRSQRSDHSPMYPVSDTGDFRAAAEDLNGRVDGGDIVIAPKDLGFYLGSKVIEGEDAFARGDARLADVIRTRRDVVAIARNTFGPPYGPETLELMDRCFKERREFGTALVAYRSGSCG